MRILDLNLNDAEAVTKEIATAGGSASAHSWDVSDQKQVISTFDHLAKQSKINRDHRDDLFRRPRLPGAQHSL
jgi:hypothetical protein